MRPETDRRERAGTPGIQLTVITIICSGITMKTFCPGGLLHLPGSGRATVFMCFFLTRMLISGLFKNVNLLMALTNLVWN
jgi:hypothetical protein